MTPPGLARPLTLPPDAGPTALLEQRLSAAQVELRKLGSERHTLRARLRRENDRARELESALRAEKDLHAQASDEHFSVVVGLRSRLAELDAEREAERRQLRDELERAQGELSQLRSELELARRQALQSAASASSTRAVKPPQGLRRIRGIGPAYERVLEHGGVTGVEQIAAWTQADVLEFAERLKIKPERITKDDWVGQARALLSSD